MKQTNKVIGIIVVLALLAAAASASVPAKLTVTTDKNTYNWNEKRPQVIIYNAGNTTLDIASATLQITNDSGISIYRQQLDIDVLKPKRNYTVTVRLNSLLPAGKYKAFLVYSLSGCKVKYTVSSDIFVVSPPLVLTTVVNGAKDVRFTVTNPGTQDIDLSLVKMQVYSDKDVPLYGSFSVCPSCDPLQPNKSIEFGWGVFGGTPAGIYQGKMLIQTSGNWILVVNGDVFIVK
jgi:uncharacterized membrane protein